MSGPIGIDFVQPRTGFDVFVEQIAEGKSVEEAAAASGHGVGSANWLARRLGEQMGEVVDVGGH